MYAIAASIILLLLPKHIYVFANENEQTCDPSVDQKCSNTKLTHIRLGLEWFINPDHLPLVVAIKEGIFEDFGLNVELIEPKDHWEAEKEILDGRLDVAVTEPLHLAVDAMNSKPVLGFSRFLHTDGGVMYKKGVGINRPSDMCGRTISYPGSPGPGGPAIVQTMVEADGGNCDISSYGKYNGGFYHTDAIKSGNADLATLIFWNFEIPEAKAQNVDVDFFSLKDFGVPDFCQLVLFTTPDHFGVMKESLRKLVLAMRKATGIIHRNPDLAREHYLSYVGEAEDEVGKSIQIATMTATLPAFPNDNSMSRDYYERLMSWLSSTGQVSEETNSADVAKYWTNEIAW
mmetsp:Transcript_38316/g.44653  ORF Transcript_38316/g.44653 Transcript_38316/m.44653 type:complete len:345 (-) Transcript_38316:422-1456(-)|eukprot:CAMPEP_0194406426 /NCGR_PEP_ID=MMETSP0176-20130528/4641_1 /TAXON_ID=216777 /ORGANISM="Proboscia alata, Strain PI-D3" /LENGTH=344 /DNA_ID=CAMNT_0039205635 /DNA_START=38 /DNA_END=1072 /DNA_ORIENTATION=+